MRIICLIFMLLVTACTIKAQDFCGLIKYRYTYYKGKNQKDVTEAVKEIKTEDFYICGNKFKTVFDGKLSEILIGDSTAYFFVVSDSTMGYIRANAAYGQHYPDYRAVKTCLYQNKEYKCLEEKLRNETMTYYFDDDVRINKDQFRDIELYHWNKFFEATNGALRLISISKKRHRLRVSEVVDVIRMKPEQIDFSIPAGFKIEEREGFKVYN